MTDEQRRRLEIKFSIYSKLDKIDSIYGALDACRILGIEVDVDSDGNWTFKEQGKEI